MNEELYKKYRPNTFDEVIGQDEAVATLKDLGKRKAMPHTILLSGPSGCGKTTIARILRKKMKCGDADFIEANAAQTRGIDFVRSVQSKVNLIPISGTCRVWLIDEVGNLTSDAQHAFLKLLEDTPKHAYFILATTDPQKLKKTIRTRCTEIKVRLLNIKELSALVNTVTKKESSTLTEDVVSKLVDHSDGSARKALVLLHSIIGLENEDAQLDAISKGDHRAQAIELCRALISKKPWPEVAEILKTIEDEPETLRYAVLGYSRSIMLKGGKMLPRAHMIVEEFSEPFYTSGQAGLCAACYRVLTG